MLDMKEKVRVLEKQLRKRNTKFLKNNDQVKDFHFYKVKQMEML